MNKAWTWIHKARVCKVLLPLCTGCMILRKSLKLIFHIYKIGIKFNANLNMTDDLNIKHNRITLPKKTIVYKKCFEIYKIIIYKCKGCCCGNYQ